MAERRVFGEPPPLATNARSLSPLARHKALLLALMVALWIGAGLFGRDPWKPQETDIVIFIAEQTGAIVHLPDSARPDLPISVYPHMAAAMAKLTSPFLSLHEGARLINALLLGGGFLMIGLVAGGGRRGWMAVLLTLGMTGLTVRAHLLNLSVAAFFGAALMLLGAAVLLRRRTLSGSGTIGAAALLLFTAASPSIALFAFLGMLLALLRADWRSSSVLAGLMAAAVFFVPAALLSPAAAVFADALTPTNDWRATTDLLRLSAWALFPTLPMAAAVIYRHKMDAMMFLCLMMMLMAALHFILYGGREEDLFWLMPPLAIFAARGLHNLSADTAQILDWFAIIVVGVCCVGGMWAMWILWQSGLGGEWMADWRGRFPLLESPDGAAMGWKIIPAALATVLWAGLAANFGRSPERAILNWSCGITAVWCVFSLLWMPIIDSGKSYRRMAAAVTMHSGGDCVYAASGTGLAAAQLYYFGVVAGDSTCRWRFQTADSVAPDNFYMAWQGGRYDRKNYALYRLRDTAVGGTRL